MISASDPQVFAPHGRKHMEQHPGEVVLPSTHPQLQPESFLLHRLSQVAISEHNKEWWTIKSNVSGELQFEDELYVSGKTLVWSHGIVSGDNRSVLRSYTSENLIQHALWCTFYTSTDSSTLINTAFSEEPKGEPMPSVCVVDSNGISTFTLDGKDYVSSLPFQVQSIWTTKFGVLLEANSSVSISDTVEYQSLHGANSGQVPIVFSLSHPLDEISPVVSQKCANSLSYITDSCQKIVFTNENPSICMTYDSRSGLHSVWKVRKIYPEESQSICARADISKTVDTTAHSSAITKSNVSGSLHASASIISHISGIIGPRERFPNLFNPYEARSSAGNSHSNSVQGSRSQSPMAALSRCQSPSICDNNLPRVTLTSSPQGWVTRSAQRSRSAFGPGTSNSATYVSAQDKISSSYISMDTSAIESKPLVPEICFEHLWTEPQSFTKDLSSGSASEVFLTTNFIGETFMCYLLHSQFQLICVELKENNSISGKLVFGACSTIQARHAANLPLLHMIAVVDLNGLVVLYSGVNFVSKVHIPGIAAAVLQPSYISFNQYLSPFPKRSSLLSSHRGSSVEPNFDESFHLLSPVVPDPSHAAAHLNGSSFEEPPTGLVRLRDSVGNRVTLEYGNGSYFRLSLPQLSSSRLVSDCLAALKCILGHDLAMQLFTKWYGVRNAPGTQNVPLAVEWQMFIVVLFELMGYELNKLSLVHQETEGTYSPVFLTKKKRALDCGSEEDWDYFLGSTHHESVGHSLCAMLGLKSPPCYAGCETESCGKVDSNAVLFPHIPLILFSLHLVYEEFKLNLLLSESLPYLAQLLHQLAFDLQLEVYVNYYWRDFPKLCPLFVQQKSQISPENLEKLQKPKFINSVPPSIFDHIYSILRNHNPAPFPYIHEINRRTKDVAQIVGLLYGKCSESIPLHSFVQFIQPKDESITHNAPAVPIVGKGSIPEQVVLLMSEIGMTPRDIQTLPAGIALLLNTAIYLCRQNPPSDWPESAYRLVVRQDLAAQCHPKQTKPRPSSLSNMPCSNIDNRKSGRMADAQDDGMEGMDMEVLKLRFNKDHRVAEVRRLLQSSHPVRIAITQRPEVSDHEFIEEQEKHLYALCTRTMALVVGRGMFTLRTAAPVITEPLPIPRLCLTGKAPPRGTTVDLTHIEVVPNMNLWPLFHNGVAAGLRISPSACDIDSTWIIYNKPKGNSDVPTEHAGFLMALGLNGHLGNLAVLSTYEYLVKCHEMTSVGLLLGIAATKRGTMDLSTTKLLSIHVEALLPPTSIELDIPQNIQVAALLGVGLVYEGTAHRHIAEVLLSEIGRPPGPEMENSVDRESYSLAAGLALGLVVFGQGSKLTGLADLAIPDTLHYYMVGGHRRPLTGSQKEKYKSPSYQIREGDAVNIDVTSPGATLALGMMYFHTGNKAVAEWMKPPDTQYLLDFVRPDFLLLRVVARGLILWDEILPTSEWVESHVPDTIRPYCLCRPRTDMVENVDYETMNQAYCNILAGACMALGLRFAGSANNKAFLTLLKYTKMFTSLSGKSIAELAGKSTIETCLNVIVLSLAMVMAGTGELEVLRICRYLRSRVGPMNSVVTYGSHLATHMALGLLFLGGGHYTLSTSPSALAAMICAFFPKFPTHSNDNRYHLQAFRHLYVLAVEPRLLLPRDIDTGQLCYVHLSVVFLDTKWYKNQSVKLCAPCLLPELSRVKEVKIEDDRYWTITFSRGSNWGQLKNLMGNNGYLDVKQKAGCLSYLEDPQGFRSLLAQTLTCEEAMCWSVSPASIFNFSSDPAMVNFTHYFVENNINCTEVEKELVQILSTLVYECVMQDKPGILPIWITFLKALHTMDASPSVFLMWQLKILFVQALTWKNVQAKKSPNPQDMFLVSTDFALSMYNQTEHKLENWEADLKPLLKQYLTGVPINSNEHLAKLTAYLTFHDIPNYHKFLPILRMKMNPFLCTKKLSTLGLSATAMQKISSILCNNM